MATRPGQRPNTAKIKDKAASSKKNVALNKADQKADMARKAARAKAQKATQQAEKTFGSYAASAKKGEEQIAKLDEVAAKSEVMLAKLDQAEAKLKKSGKPADELEPMIGQIDSKRETITIEFQRRRKQRQELETNLNRLGRKAEKEAKEYVASVQVDGFKPPPPPKPIGAGLWVGAYLAAMVIYIRLVKKGLL